MDVEEVAKLWADYQTTKTEQQPAGDLEIRNRLVVHHMPLVDHIATRMADKFGHSITFDEFRSSGYEGLIKAVEAFKPERGCQFNMYAPQRIRGAMVDYVRNLDRVPRLVRQQVAMVGKAEISLMLSLGRKPDDGELLEAVAAEQVASKSPTTPREVLKQYHLLATHVSKSLDAEVYEGDTRKTLVGDLISSDEPDPSDSSYDDFDYLLRGLTEDEKLIIILYYREEFTMRAIGAIMGLSESMISRSHDEIIKRLRDSFAARRRFCRG